MLKPFSAPRFLFSLSIWLLIIPLGSMLLDLYHLRVDLSFAGFFSYLNAGIIGFILAVVFFAPWYLFKYFNGPAHFILMMLYMSVVLYLKNELGLEEYPIDIGTVYFTMNAAYISLLVVNGFFGTTERVSAKHC